MNTKSLQKPAQTINQLGCWRKHRDWRNGDSVVIDELRLTEKQKTAIRKGHTIRQGNWTFYPCIYEDMER